MRASPVLLILLCLLFLAGCEQGSVAPLAQALFPTATPTLVPSPTPTRVDEVVIPFESVAVNQLQANLPPVIDDPDITADFSLTYSNDAEMPLQPVIFLVTSPEEATLFQDWLPSEILNAIAGVDFREYIVIAFFEALSPASDGYIARIAIEQNGQVTVYAVLRRFSSATADITFPSHIVKLRRQDIPFPVSTGTNVKLETETRIIN